MTFNNETYSQLFKSFCNGEWRSSVRYLSLEFVSCFEFRPAPARMLMNIKIVTVNPLNMYQRIQYLLVQFWVGDFGFK